MQRHAIVTIYGTIIAQRGRRSHENKYSEGALSVPPTLSWRSRMQTTSLLDEFLLYTFIWQTHFNMLNGHLLINAEFQKR